MSCAVNLMYIMSVYINQYAISSAHFTDCNCFVCFCLEQPRLYPPLNMTEPATAVRLAEPTCQFVYAVGAATVVMHLRSCMSKILLYKLSCKFQSPDRTFYSCCTSFVSSILIGRQTIYSNDYTRHIWLWRVYVNSTLSSLDSFHYLHLIIPLCSYLATERDVLETHEVEWQRPRPCYYESAFTSDSPEHITMISRYCLVKPIQYPEPELTVLEWVWCCVGSSDC